MNIDATLFLQAVNFFVLYVAVRWLWLRPSITILDKQHELLEQHIQNVTTKKDAITLLKDRTQQEYHQAHLYFCTNQPEVVEQKKIKEKELMPLQEPSSDNITILSKQAVQEIITKIDGSV
jgi:F0F1-type ATP synthase membrane subunit b/b'